jgi:hypothetical protein
MSKSATASICQIFKKDLRQPFRQPIDNKSEISKDLTKMHFYNINNNNKYLVRLPSETLKLSIRTHFIRQKSTKF